MRHTLPSDKRSLISDIILDVYNSVQRKVSTCENKMGLREKKDFYEKTL